MASTISTTDVEAYTDDELISQQERVSQAALGVSRDEAYRQLDAGKLDGQQIEVELKMLRYLLTGEY